MPPRSVFLPRILAPTLSSLLSCSILWGHGQALAQGIPTASTPSTAVVYHAPDECPNIDEFKIRILARIPWAVLSKKSAHRTLLVEVYREEAVFKGSLQVRTGLHTSSRRKVEGVGCEEVVDALAVVGSLAVNHLDAQPTTTAEDTALTPSDPLGTEPLKDNGPTDDLNTSAASRPSVSESETTPLPPTSAKHRHQHVSRELKKGQLVSIDIQAGATIGRASEEAAARFDLSVRTGALLVASESERFLYGAVPRLRGNIQPLSRAQASGYEIQSLGFGVAAGSCFTPYFEPEGLKVFACADFGASRFTVEALRQGVNSIDEVGIASEVISVPIQRYWTGVATLSIESEFKIVSFIHAAVRVALQQETRAAHVFLDPEGNELMTFSATTAVGSAGLGIHF